MNLIARGGANRRRGCGKVDTLRFYGFLAYVLSAFLAAPAALPQQARILPSQAKPGGLKIVVIEGEGAKNSIRKKTATAPLVEVRDEQDKPVAGAEVEFQLPMAGPGGTFNGWLRLQKAKTDAQGRAAASGYTPNEEEGRFNIKVTAATQGAEGTAVIAQANVWNGTGEAKSTSSSKKTLWVVLGVAAAAAVGGGIYAATSGSDDTATVTPANPVRITVGPISVGGPR